MANAPSLLKLCPPCLASGGSSRPHEAPSVGSFRGICLMGIFYPCVAPHLLTGVRPQGAPLFPELCLYPCGLTDMDSISGSSSNTIIPDFGLGTGSPFGAASEPFQRTPSLLSTWHPHISPACSRRCLLCPRLVRRPAASPRSLVPLADGV